MLNVTHMSACPFYKTNFFLRFVLDHGLSVNPSTPCKLLKYSQQEEIFCMNITKMVSCMKLIHSKLAVMVIMNDNELHNC